MDVFSSLKATVIARARLLVLDLMGTFNYRFEMVWLRGVLMKSTSRVLRVVSLANHNILG